MCATLSYCELAMAISGCSWEHEVRIQRGGHWDLVLRRKTMVTEGEIFFFYREESRYVGALKRKEV